MNAQQLAENHYVYFDIIGKDKKYKKLTIQLHAKDINQFAKEQLEAVRQGIEKLNEHTSPASPQVAFELAIELINEQIEKL